MLNFNFDDIRDLLDVLENDFSCLEDLVYLTYGEREVCNEVADGLADLGKVAYILNQRSRNISGIISKYSNNGGEANASS